MRYALLLLFAGCQAAVDIDRADIIAELATQYAAIVVKKPEAPKPVTPREGCVEGCRCNGTGKERSGDGLAVVNCRCQDDCKCKPKMEPLVEAPKKQPDRGHVVCENGVCYWVDELTGAKYRVVK